MLIIQQNILDTAGNPVKNGSTGKPQVEHIYTRCGYGLCIREKCIVPHFNPFRGYANATLRPIADTKPLILEDIRAPDNRVRQLLGHLFHRSDPSQVFQKNLPDAAASPVVYHHVPLFL
jgi:hypothetical protein